MPHIRPVTDLQKPAEISKLCNSGNEPVFLTNDGNGDMVIMSVATYESLLETAHTDRAISEAEQEYAQDGILLDAREALATLRSHHFG